jgi:flagellar basal-body rod protein FlgG
VVSHNLANTLTPAYKRLWPVDATFNRVLGNASAERNDLPTEGVAIDQAVDFRSVPLRQTGNSLDLAIEGKGFFEIHDGENIYFSRQGNFTLDAMGRLTTATGMAVAGLGGDIRLQSAQVRIDSLGRIYEKDQQVAQLKLIAFQNAVRLTPAGEGRYTAANASIQVADENVTVRKGIPSLRTWWRQTKWCV